MVNVQQLRNQFSRLEKKRDSLLESRDFDNLKICLDQLDEIKQQLALHDPDSEFAKKLRFEKMKTIFKKN